MSECYVTKEIVLKYFMFARDGDDGSIVVIGVDSPHSHCSPWLNLLH